VVRVEAPRVGEWDRHGGIGSEIRIPRLLLTGTECAWLPQITGSLAPMEPSSKAETLKDENPWFAVYTRSRHERRVAETLEQRGFESYLPLMARVSEWHDRKKTVYWPLFPGYVFVRFKPEDASTVLSIPGSVQLIGVAGRPAPIPDDEIDNVRLFAACLEETGVVPVSSPSVELGERVVVRGGPFAGVRGVVLEYRGVERVLIQIGLSSIGQSLKIELDTESIEAIDSDSQAYLTRDRRMK
jgi:transcription antitermination factor NusG